MLVQRLIRIPLRTITVLSFAMIAPDATKAQTEQNYEAEAQYFAAVMKGDEAAVKRHLQAGVRVDATNALGLTGLQLAAYQVQPHVVKAIIDALPAKSKDLSGEAEISFQDYLDSISFDTYADDSLRTKVLNGRAATGQTALHLAIGAIPKQEATYAEIVTLLLEAGADVNVVDHAGNTPLHLAVRNGYSQVVKALLHHRAETTIRNKSSQIPADFTTDMALRRMLADAETLQPIVENDTMPQNSNKVRIIVIGEDGKSREIDFDSLGKPGQLNPAGVDPDWNPGGITDFESGEPYQLSTQQSLLKQKLGNPDFFNIVLIADDLGTRVINTRLEKWVYARGGKMFSFCDGECTKIVDFEPPEFKNKTVVHYRPTQFAAGMTQADIEKRFGSQFRRKSLSEMNIRSADLKALEYWSDGTVTLGFAQQKLILVQASCRSIPRP
ncbi:MAG: ankyrin repeat domain-containing protein [Fuerstiella sp.]